MTDIGFDIPDYKKIRVIVDTDAACEADDPFAIVHALLSPKLIVRGVIAEHFNMPHSMEDSFDEISAIKQAMALDFPSFMGQTGPLFSDSFVSEGVDLIIKEALSDSTYPLFVLCQGAITNVAMAIKTNPDIIGRMTVIWIGTHGEAPCTAPFREFNAGNDIEAANYVLKSGIDLWLVPSQVYTTINIGIAEIKRRISPLGDIGRHLYENLMTYNNSEGAGWTQGESWSLGDSPAIAIAINPGCGHYKTINAPTVADDTSSIEDPEAPKIRLYTDVDSRYILEDLIAKLELFCEEDG
ncbi:MAG: nucleoside hydrolase [Lachnospiraceae bacterium]|nr:nucleoside hydrolase [Lachnospiraceae bacterium]